LSVRADGECRSRAAGLTTCLQSTVWDHLPEQAAA
jgi:hypothetical protein